MSKYDERCAAEGMICFIPLAVDTFGGWHGAALDAIVKIEWAAAGTATWRGGGGGDQALVAETVYPAHHGQYGHAGEPQLYHPFEGKSICFVVEIQRTHYFLLMNPLIVTFWRANNVSGSPIGE